MEESTFQRIEAGARALNAAADAATAEIHEIDQRLTRADARVQVFLQKPIVEREALQRTLPSGELLAEPYPVIERAFLGYSRDGGRWGVTVRTEVWRTDVPGDRAEQVHYQLLQVADRELRIIAGNELPRLLNAVRAAIEAQVESALDGRE
jgi:hypothetical protein